MREPLPIDGLLADIVESVAANSVTILRAAPGAGKTTRVPPALAEKFSGKVVVVEPRRVAACGAANRISDEAETSCGKYAGYIVRGEKRCSSDTRILAVTTGIFLNMLLRDPSLDGVSAVVFDEFHERSMQSDLGFTLTLETLKILRDDLKIVVMSATIDENKIRQIVPGAAFLDVPGRMFELDIEYNPDGITAANMLKTCVVHTVDAVKNHSGNALVFLPGAGEINQLKDALEDFASANGILLQTLHGRMTLDEQSRVLHPDGKQRRVVLATNIAESSVTIPDISIVIDSGFCKRLVHDAATGFDRLETVRISLDSAGQRAGRAGRTCSGYVKRLWSRSDERGFLPHTEAEIANCDLALLALALADWGSREDELSWVTFPDASRLAEARKLLRFLGALDGDNNITALGRKMSSIPVHPRISAMLTACGNTPEQLRLGCETAAVLEELSGNGADGSISDLIYRLRRHPGAMRRADVLAKQLMNMMDVKDAFILAPENCSTLVMQIYPDRVAKYSGRMYRFSGGGAGVLVNGNSDEGTEFIACAAIQGTAQSQMVIRMYEKSSADEVRTLFSDRITEEISTVMEPDSGRVICRREEKFGELVLSSSPCAAEPADVSRAVIVEALRRKIAIPDLSDKKALQFFDRVVFASKQGDDEFPDWSNDGEWKNFLLENVAVSGSVRSFSDLKNCDLVNAMKGYLGYEKCSQLDRLYPEYFTTPANCRHLIDYSGDVPVLRAKVQELYGVKVHPCVGKKRLPLKIDLLSPALRSTQITSDLPGFWKNSWHLVRKDMKSRYPKHDWPEDPENALPHTKVRL